MDNKIVEAVAWEYVRFSHENPHFIARKMILATIKAIEEPSEEMKAVGAKILELAIPVPRLRLKKPIAANVWGTMLQALSKSIEGGTN